jgi:hypothetical protein
LAQRSDHELSETRAFDIYDIFEAADGERRDQISAAQSNQILDFLMAREGIYYVTCSSSGAIASRAAIAAKTIRTICSDADDRQT